MSVAGSEETQVGVSEETLETEGESGAEAQGKSAGAEIAEAAPLDEGEVEPGVLETAATDVADELAEVPIEPTLEAILFAAAEPIPLQRLSRLFQGRGRGSVKQALEALRETLAESGRGVRLVEVSSGFQLRSAPEHAPWLRRFFADKPPRLSRALLETVAIIAYRQPVTRGEIEAIRGVNCDAILTALLNRDLVLSTGRRDTPGRPVEYGTTAEFLELFTMKNLSELPPLPDAESLANFLKEAPAEDDDGAVADASEEPGDESGDSDEDGGPGGGYGAEVDQNASFASDGYGEREAEDISDLAGAEEEPEPRASAMAAAVGAGAPGTILSGDASDDGQNHGTERTDSEDPQSSGDSLPPGRGGDDS
jgi:segregation and condensation protein B